MLYLYSIVKAQQNLHNDMCALQDYCLVFAAGWIYRGRRGEGWVGTGLCGVGVMGSMGWVRGVGVGLFGMGWGVSGGRDSVGRAVAVVEGLFGLGAVGLARE